MTIQEEDNIKFIIQHEKLFQKAKRLLYKYGDQTPFTEGEMQDILKIMEIVGGANFTFERLEVVRREEDDDD